MNCREAQPLLSAARDGALPPAQRAELERHVAGCAACQAWQVELAAVTAHVRAETAQVELPDVDEEWRRLQASLHASPGRTRRLAPIAWIGLPVAAAAAVALAFFVGRPTPSASGPDVIASVDYVEISGRDATPVVYVDNDSGMLVVWAVDNAPAAAKAD